MNDILRSLLIFIGTSICHVCIYRLLMRNGYKTFKTVLVYGLGSILLIYSTPNFANNPQALYPVTINNVMLPFTGIIIYSLLSIFSIMLFTSPYTGDTSPTLKILQLIKRRGARTAKMIYASFSETELTGNRLSYLIQIGYIKKQGKKFYILPKGQKTNDLIHLYRYWLNWKSSG